MALKWIKKIIRPPQGHNWKIYELKVYNTGGGCQYVFLNLPNYDKPFGWDEKWIIFVETVPMKCSNPSMGASCPKKISPHIVNKPPWRYLPVWKTLVQKIVSLMLE